MKRSFTAKLAMGLPALVAALAFTQSPTASAAATIGVNVLGTGTSGGGYQSTDLWTNLTDSALAVGFNPALLIPPGAPYDITLISQTRVGAFQLNGVPVFPQAQTPNLQYEITKVLNIQERPV
jgi:hypothetical protein